MKRRAFPPGAGDNKGSEQTTRTRFFEVTDQLGLLLCLGRLCFHKQFGAREFSLLLQLGFVELEFLFVFREDGGVGSFQTGVEVVLYVRRGRGSALSPRPDKAHWTIAVTYVVRQGDIRQ